MTSVFPRTELTRILDWVQSADTASLRRYLMAVYAEPLRGYYGGIRRRAPGVDADDAVNRFFEEYLIDREGGVLRYFQDWLDRGEDPLRLYLQRGFCLSISSERKKRLREGLRTEPGDHELHLAQIESTEPPADVQFDKAVVRQTVRFALELAGERMPEKYRDHWEYFLRHHLYGESCPQIAADTGLAKERVEVMVRTGKRAFIRETVGLIAQSGPPHGVQQTLEDYLEIIRS